DGLLYLLLPDFPAEKIAAHLQRFVFRSKVKLVQDKDKVFAAEFDFTSASNAHDYISGSIEAGLFLDFSSDSISRGLWLIPGHSAADIRTSESLEAKWRDADIRHGLP